MARSSGKKSRARRSPTESGRGPSTGPRPTVVLGLLGPTLDRGGRNRWDRWRPTVDLCRHEDFAVDRLELLVQPAGDRRALAGMQTWVDEVEDDIAVLSPSTQVVRVPLRLGDPWDFESVYAALLDFARGYPFAADDEDYLVHITTGTHVAQICLFLLTETHELPARLLQTSPPGPGRRADPGTLRIIDLDLSKYDQLASRFAARQAEDLSFLKAGIATRNPRFNAIIERIERVVLASRAPILLTGPTGSGKTRLARRIYELARERRQISGRFVEVNCATLRGDTAMSALFGHEKGAFTGAVGRRDGLLLAAHQGLLFLDEIGELGLDEQAMLLRAIEDRRFMPMGSEREQASDFALIAGSNRDLRQEVARGRFREDLFYRLAVVELVVPPLRERRDDIPALAREFGRRYGEKFGLGPLGLEPALVEALRREDWPGNVRQLENTIARLAALAATGPLTLAAYRERLPGGGRPAGSVPVGSDDDDAEAPAETEGLSLREQVEAFERGVVARALAEQG
ncbi:MAG: sigma 54-interacting transcriptional regulator, partial [Myxococcales bacterium]|nr:sigma 54-interacting transcriptional regulator [Myxococcales bacterium]